MIRLVVSPVLMSILVLGLYACVPDAPTGLDGDRRPGATISAPASGAEFPAGEPVAFRGVATDEEDGALPDPSLRWYSSLDGVLGTGPELIRDDLTVGVHQIRLIATDSDGHADTARITIGIDVPPNAPPSAAFSYGCDGLSCAFTDGSSDPDGAVVGWAWDFGDGATSGDRNPTHVFASGDEYDVVLTVTDDDGETAGVIRTVPVSQPNQGPVAAFSWTCADLACQFTDASSDADGTITAWSWEFGDGGTSTERNPAYEFDEAGTWSVSLTVTDDDAAESSSTREVSVTGVTNRPPVARILEPDDGSEWDEDDNVQFRGEASDPDGDEVRLEWRSDRDGPFGTGTVVNTKDLREGEHEITLVASDGELTGTDTITIRIDD